MELKVKIIKCKGSIMTDMFKQLIIVFIAFIVLTCLTLKLFSQSVEEINNYADRVSQFYDIPVSITRAVIEVESSYNVKAKSKKDAYGLMQITEPAYADYLKSNPSTYITNFEIVKNNWKANIAVGCWYLKEFCYKQEGNWKCALTSFFWGVNNVVKTDTYYNKIVIAYNKHAVRN